VPGGGAGTAALWRRAVLAARRRQAGRAPVPAAAAAKRVQRPGQVLRAADGSGAALAGWPDARDRGDAAADGRHPIPCGQSVVTAKRSDLYGWAGYGYCASHSRWYWGSKLLLICTCDGTVTGFGLASPKLYGEREEARQLLEHQPANRPAPGTTVVTDKGLSGKETEEFFAGDDLRLTLVRPARKDEKEPRSFPNWLRQRVEAIIWTLKKQLGLERHGGRVPAGLWARIVLRLLALNACIWHNWNIGAPVKRSLIAYDHMWAARISRSTI
jgi:hypothetical protein